MVKHTQTIRRQKPTKCLSVFDHFVGLALRVKMNSPTYDINLYLGILLQKYIRIKEDKKCKVLIFKESSKTFHGNFWKCDTQLKKDILIFNVIEISNYLNFWLKPANETLQKNYGEIQFLRNSLKVTKQNYS